MTSKCVQSKKQNVLDSRLPRILLACWLLAGLFFLVPRHGRSQTQELHSSLDNATRTEVVEAAAKALEERYIFADDARAMAKELRAQNAAHAYDLSITHKLGSEDEAELDICEACETSPHDGVSRRRVFCSCQVAPEPSEFGEI
jgi:hypothetical protein